MSQPWLWLWPALPQCDGPPASAGALIRLNKATEPPMLKRAVLMAISPLPLSFAPGSFQCAIIHQCGEVWPARCGIRNRKRYRPVPSPQTASALRRSGHSAQSDAIAQPPLFVARRPLPRRASQRRTKPCRGPRFPSLRGVSLTYPRCRSVDPQRQIRRNTRCLFSLQWKAENDVNPSLGYYLP